MRLTFVIVWFTVLFSSCSDDAKPVFTMELEADFEIPSGLNNFDTHYFIVRNVPTRIRSYLNAFPAENLERILASRALLTGQFRNIDYGIVQSITIHVVSNLDPTNKKEVFFFEFVPFNLEGDLELFSSLPNLKDILIHETFDLEVRIIFKTFTPNNLESRLIMNFNAYAVE